MPDMPVILQIYREGSDGAGRDEEPVGRDPERRPKIRGLEGGLVAALLQLGR